MKKVGIITLYHGSHNYGGLLQAYAMCQAVKSRGYDAEQITFNRENEKLSKKTKVNFLVSGIKSFLRTKNCQFRTSLLQKKFDERKAGFCEFRDSIPHSKEFTSDTISECNDIYDIFVTGSDQVWNPMYLLPEYLLDFVKDHPKFAYAASISQKMLTVEQETYFADSVSDYIGVSIREKENAEQFCKIYPNSKWVLDPTLLLTKDEWGKVASPRLIKEKYLFCYFIGLNKHSRKMAKQYAKVHGLKLVSIPHFNNVWSKADSGFGDYKLYKVPPNDWISLVKNAECVFTDSFHATVFSNIFEKDFFVFNRESTGIMNNRIYSLLGMLNKTERFIDKTEKMKIEHLNMLGSVEYNMAIPEFLEMYKSSCEYLDDCLNASLTAIKQKEGKNE